MSVLVVKVSLHVHVITVIDHLFVDFRLVMVIVSVIVAMIVAVIVKLRRRRTLDSRWKFKNKILVFQGLSKPNLSKKIIHELRKNSYVILNSSKNKINFLLTVFKGKNRRDAQESEYQGTFEHFADFFFL